MMLNVSELPPVDLRTIFAAEIQEQTAYEAAKKGSSPRGATDNSGEAWRKAFRGSLATLDIAKLAEEKGLGPRSLGNGKYAITCPWSTEHSTGIDGDSSTVVFGAIDGQWPGFKCQHAHCVQRRLQHFLEICGPELVDAHCRETFRNGNAGSRTAHGPNDPWPERSQLPPIATPAPEMTLEMVPEPLRAWVTDTAERIGVSLEFVAVPAVAALAIVIGRKFGIFPKKHDTGWQVFCSVLWAVIVARPSKKKSPSIRAALGPLMALEKTAREAFDNQQKDNARGIAILEAKISGVKNAIKKMVAEKKDTTWLEETFRTLTDSLEKLKIKPRRYAVQDVTVEKLSEIHRDNPNGLGITLDELTGWLTGMDRQGHEASRAFFLKGWDGNTGDLVDRIGRGTIAVSELYLVVVGGIQPGKFQKYVRDATSGGHDDDGLLQRFQLMVMPAAGRKPYIDRAPDYESFKRVENIFTWLDGLGRKDSTETQESSVGWDF